MGKGKEGVEGAGDPCSLGGYTRPPVGSRVKRSGSLGTEMILGVLSASAGEEFCSFIHCPALVSMGGAVMPTLGCPVGLFQQMTFVRAGMGCPGKMRIPLFPVRESCSLQPSC